MTVKSMGSAGEIRVSVRTEGLTNLPLHELNGIQGKLKEFASKEVREKCRRTLIKDGISFAFHVWKMSSVDFEGRPLVRWYIIDGHGRRKVLIELEEDGWKIPLVPCVEIIAPDYESAKLLVLNSSSEYHTITEDGFVDYISDITPARLEDVKVHLANISIPHVKIEDTFNRHFVSAHLRRDPTPQSIDEESEPAEVEPLTFDHNGEGLNARLQIMDCLEGLREMPDCIFDSMVTDPPAGISFMGKEWDDDKGGRDKWIAWLSDVMREAMRTLKPGAHALVWALPRTSHWTATALEDAGFEIRDVVTHLFGSGFPKSHDVSKAIDRAAGAEREIISAKVGPKPGTHGGTGQYGHGEDRSITTPTTPEAKQWEGFGTALKPASENWILCRKPIEGTIAENILKWGTGGINIDGCRIGTDDVSCVKPGGGGKTFHGAEEKPRVSGSTSGRFPANLVLSHNPDCGEECSPGCAAGMLDEQSGVRPGFSGGGSKGAGYRSEYVNGTQKGITLSAQYYSDTGGASRFFYCPKPSVNERNAGLSDREPETVSDGREIAADNAFQRGATLRLNTHPTLKPIRLMRYFTRLITPPGGIVLDPFTGSGTTAIAALCEKFNFCGFEKNPEYAEIARGRITSAFPAAAFFEKKSE